MHSSWRRCFQGSNVSYNFSAQHRWRCGRKGQDETEKSSAQVVCHSSAVSLSWLEATSCRKPCFFVCLWGKCTKRCGKRRVSRSENYLWRLVYSCLQEGDGGCQWIEGRSVLVLCKILESSSVLGTQSANSKSQCPHWHSVAVNRTKEDYFSGVQQQQGIDPDSIFGRVPRCVTGLRSMVVSGWTIGVQRFQQWSKLSQQPQRLRSWMMFFLSPCTSRRRVFDMSKQNPVKMSKSIHWGARSAPKYNLYTSLAIFITYSNSS